MDNTVFMRVNKKLCQQIPSKFEGRPNYNIVHLPKGTVVGDTDLSYSIINPIVMIDDNKNPNMYCIIYDRSRLENNAVKVYMTVEGQKKYMPVDVDALRKAVAAANHAYYEEHKKERTQTAEKVAEKEETIAKDKMQPLTTEKLSEIEEEQEVI